MHFLQPPVPVLDTNIFLGTLFSNTVSPFSYLNVKGQVSLPYKTAGKILFYLVDRKTEDSGPNISRHSLYLLNVLLTSLCKEFWFVNVILKYLNFATVSKDLLVIFMVWLYRVFCWEDINIFLFFSSFISAPTSSLWWIKLLFKYLCFCPIN
jgi:hypothetical protein